MYIYIHKKCGNSKLEFCVSNFVLCFSRTNILSHVECATDSCICMFVCILYTTQTNILEYRRQIDSKILRQRENADDYNICRYILTTLFVPSSTRMRQYLSRYMEYIGRIEVE